MPRTPEEAIAAARHQFAHGAKFGEGKCQMRCHLAYGLPADGTPDATAGWARSKHRHPTLNPAAILRGALVYWAGGSQVHGHVAIATGDGHCWSTDNKRTGFFGRVPISSIPSGT